LNEEKGLTVEEEKLITRANCGKGNLTMEGEERKNRRGGSTSTKKVETKKNSGGGKGKINNWSLFNKRRTHGHGESDKIFDSWGPVKELRSVDF